MKKNWNFHNWFFTLLNISWTYSVGLAIAKRCSLKAFCTLLLGFLEAAPYTLCTGGHFKPAHLYLESTTILLGKSTK